MSLLLRQSVDVEVSPSVLWYYLSQDERGALWTEVFKAQSPVLLREGARSSWLWSGGLKRPYALRVELQHAIAEWEVRWKARSRLPAYMGVDLTLELWVLRNQATRITLRAHVRGWSRWLLRGPRELSLRKAMKTVLLRIKDQAEGASLELKQALTVQVDEREVDVDPVPAGRVRVAPEVSAPPPAVAEPSGPSAEPAALPERADQRTQVRPRDTFGDSSVGAPTTWHRSKSASR